VAGSAQPRMSGAHAGELICELAVTDIRGWQRLSAKREISNPCGYPNIAEYPQPCGTLCQSRQRSGRIAQTGRFAGQNALCSSAMGGLASLPQSRCGWDPLVPWSLWAAVRAHRVRPLVPR